MALGLRHGCGLATKSFFLFCSWLWSAISSLFAGDFRVTMMTLAWNGPTARLLRLEPTRSETRFKKNLRRGSSPGSKGRLGKTQDQFAGRLDRVLSLGRSVDEKVLEELEEILLTADLGTKTSYELLDEIQKQVESRAVERGEIRSVLKEKIRSILDVQAPPLGP